MGSSFKRYPLVIAALLFSAMFIAIEIEGTDLKIGKYIFSGLVAAFALGAAKSSQESRFFKSVRYNKLISTVLALAITFAHFFILLRLPDYSLEGAVKTAILTQVCFTSFLLLPVLKTKYNYEHSLMAAFKDFFQSLLYSGVLFLGISIVLAAFDLLIFNINYKIYQHMANMVFILFAPVFFLSLTPSFAVSETESKEEGLVLEGQLAAPRFLELLLSYIVIPLIWIFTAILAAYIGLNLRADFWKDNLLEPMLISYSAMVILILLLSANLENRLAQIFRTWTPRLLIPIVLLQLAASILLLKTGFLTYQRYFVLIYGFFALIAAFIFSFKGIKKSNLIALLMIIFLGISIFPGTDAFSVSLRSQVGGLESILNKYHMLHENQLVIGEEVTEADRNRIIDTLNYLNSSGQISSLSWLPHDFNMYSNDDFRRVFGFSLYRDPAQDEKDYLSFYLVDTLSIDLFDYDFLGRLHFDSDKNGSKFSDLVFTRNQSVYTLQYVAGEGKGSLVLYLGDEALVELPIERFTQELLEQDIRGEISLEQATFEQNGPGAGMKIILDSYDEYVREDRGYFYFSAYVLVDLK